jgi:hypothetical protein
MEASPLLRTFRLERFACFFALCFLMTYSDNRATLSDSSVDSLRLLEHGHA